MYIDLSSIVLSEKIRAKYELIVGTPIINPPQSAILGMHGVFERPVVRNGQVIS